jgi:asparagine synthase (glutamine-hydrolysing)
VEARFPFLDHRLIAFASRLPARYKLMGLQEKYLLRRALHDRLPPGVLSRPKQPFRAPDGDCFFQDGRPLPWVAELLSPASLRQAGHFDPVPVAALLAKCQAGRAIGAPDNMAFMGLLSTMLLEASMVRDNAAPAAPRRGELPFDETGLAA